MTVGYSDGRVYEDEMHAHLDIPAMPSDNENLSQSKTDWSQPKKVYFVRHGETDANEEDRCRGWSSVGLNDDGRKDAQKAADDLRGTPVEHLVASDLPRAQETGRIISRKLGVPIEYDPGLRTWDTGDLTGRPNSEVKEELNRYTNETPDERPPGSVESFNEFKDRVLAAMSGITARHNDKEIGVVSHNMVGRVYHAYEEAGQPEKAMAVLNWLRGAQPTEQKAEAAVDPTHFPTDKESDEARDTNLSYGDSNARFLQPGLASAKGLAGVTFDTIGHLSKYDEQMAMLRHYSQAEPIDLEQADTYNKAWIGARRSAVSQLGFDLEHLYQAKKGDPQLNVAGLTSNKTNEMWYDPRYQTSIIHESMHRGLQKMKDAGIINEGIDEEPIVRRMMERHFGPGSSMGPEGKRLLEEARQRISDTTLDFIEAQAADYLAKKHPGGPR